VRHNISIDIFTSSNCITNDLHYRVLKMENNKKQSKLTKTAAKEERTDRKKQMDLRQALSNTPRNRKISDSETRSTSPQKRQSHSVSPEKESRRTSKRLQRLQLKHAGEIKAIEQTQKQLTDEFDDLKKSQDIEVDMEDTKHDSDGGSTDTESIQSDEKSDTHEADPDTENKKELNLDDDDSAHVEKSEEGNSDEENGDEENGDEENSAEIDKDDIEADGVEDDKGSDEIEEDRDDDKRESQDRSNDNSHDKGDDVSKEDQDNEGDEVQQDGDDDQVVENEASTEKEDDADDDASDHTPVQGSRFSALANEHSERTSTKKKKKKSSKKRDSSMFRTKPKQSTSSKSSNQATQSSSTFLDGYKNPPYAHVLYCKLKAPIPTSETPTKTLHDAFSIVIQMLRQADPSCVIFKFKDSTNRRHITKSEQIPQVLSKMKEYFDGNYRPSTQASIAWCEVKIGFNIDRETMFDDVKYLLKEHGDFAFYAKALQYQKVTCFGYLLFSTWTMDKKRVMESLEVCCEEEFKQEIQINAVWRKISDPFNATRGWNKNKKDRAKEKAMNNDDDAKALHLECEAGKEDNYASMIAKLYSTQRTTTPCGEGMRFVGYSSRYQNTSFLRKLNTLRNRQAWFSASVGTMRTYEIAELDYCSSKLTFTMRRLLMDMTTEEEGNKLFWTVDLTWNNDGIMFTFPLKHGEEARNRIADLGPYVYHYKGERAIKKYFTPAAAERALNSSWDEDNNRAISQEEEAMDDLLDKIDSDMGFMGDPTQKMEVDTSNINQSQEENNLRQTNLFNYDPNDDASLGTFGQGTVTGDRTQVLNLALQQNKASYNQHNATSKNDMVETDELTYEGDQTVDTLSSRMTSLEGFMTTMSKNMNDLVSALQKNNSGYKQVSSEESDSNAELDSSSDEGDQVHKNKIAKNTNSTTRSSAGNAKSLKGGQPAGIREVPAGKP